MRHSRMLMSRTPATGASARTHGQGVELVCRELVTGVSDYLEGVLPPGWRDRVNEHLDGCDGCTSYLRQLRATVDLLARLEAEARPT
jgi:anti-sigma factor RsiW